MKGQAIILWLFLPACCLGQARKTNQTIGKGNDYYRGSDFEKAAAEYQKALAEDPSNSTARFNLGNSFQKQGKGEEAVKQFTEVATTTNEVQLKAGAWYNAGVALTRQNKIEESIEAYKNALRKNPADRDARENLQKALLELKKKNPPPKKEENKKKKKQEKEQKEKQPQSKMSQKEAEQRLSLLQQKEKEVQQRIQKEKTKTGAAQDKDW